MITVPDSKVRTGTVSIFRRIRKVQFRWILKDFFDIIIIQMDSERFFR